MPPFPATLTGMADAIAILQTVARIRNGANTIEKGDRKVHRLVERVIAIEPALIAVKEGRWWLPSEPLRQLSETMDNIREVLNDYARSPKFKRVSKFKAAMFADLGTALTEAMITLKLEEAMEREAI